MKLFNFPNIHLNLKSHLSLEGTLSSSSATKVGKAAVSSCRNQESNMSTLIIILRPSLAVPNMWKIQIDGLHEDEMAKLSKKIEHVKFKREYVSNYISIRWRIETNKCESVMPMTHIAPLVNVFEGWGYKLLSCEKGVDYESDIIFWTLVREQEQVKSR